MATNVNDSAKLGKDPVLEILLRCVPGVLMTAGVSFFISLASLFIPLFLLLVFDRVLPTKSTGTLTTLIVIVMLAMIMISLIDYCRSQILVALSNWSAQKIHTEALEAIVRRSLRGRGNAGQSLQQINTIRVFMASSRMTATLDLVWTPIFFTALFMLHPLYGVTALVCVALLILMGVINELAVHRTTVRAGEALADSYGHFTSALRNAEPIEAMGMMGRILHRWQGTHEEALRLSVIGASRTNAVRAASLMLRLCIQVGVVVVGALLVINDMASAGSLMAAKILMSRAMAPVDGLIDGWQQWIQAGSAIRQIRDLLKENRENPRSTMPLPRPEGRLEVDRLVFVPAGHSRPVLRNISFQLEPGTSLGIIGPSAAGKSTLARLLVGLWKPTGGNIRLDGQEVYLWERTSFGQYVGYLPQSVSLFEATVRENIARLGDADPLDVVAAAKKADIHDIIGRLPLGYDTDVLDGGFALTGGQRQRIALARALFGNPSFLVLDEPDANLDQAGEMALVRTIAQAKAEGTTVVVVTHRQSVLGVLDQILVLRDGTVERFGPRQAILGAPTAAAPATIAAKKPPAPRIGLAAPGAGGTGETARREQVPQVPRS